MAMFPMLSTDAGGQNTTDAPASTAMTCRVRWPMRAVCRSCAQLANTIVAITAQTTAEDATK